MRMSSPVALGLPRVLTEEIYIDNFSLPKGKQAIVSLDYYIIIPCKSQQYYLTQSCNVEYFLMAGYRMFKNLPKNKEIVLLWTRTANFHTC